MSAEHLALAARLARTAGASPPTAVTPLEGGRNNRVFRLEHADGPRVMKLYHGDPRDPRDRLGHEWAFLTYARDRGVAALPRPLARDDEARAALLSFAPGKRIAPEAVGARLPEALAFLIALNAPPRACEDLPKASEACFSVAEHVATVERRVARLTALDPEAPHRTEAEALVAGRLQPAWDRVRAAVGPADETPLPPEAVILSPSDFGFHNALVDGEAVTFIDFEYAGLDDPAKLVGDTFGQPDVPAPPEAFEAFAADLIAGLGLGAEHLARCRRLRDLYRVKWACIMLNDFLPMDAARRAAAGQGRTADHCARQLSRVHAKLDELEP